MKSTDPTAFERKKDHIDLALQSQTAADQVDSRFYYEPILSGHPVVLESNPMQFLGHAFDHPIWISSMTGGTQWAATINKNLALACKKYNLGMGLGSCRQLLYSLENFDDFNVRPYIGDRPLFANLGIAQVEELIETHRLNLIDELIDRLSANGLIVHVNPLQEWLQPEGDRYHIAPAITIQKLMDRTNTPIIVKEVGQGMGPASLKALMKLPLQAIDFAAHGGTNFSMLEILRRQNADHDALNPLIRLGHSALEMVHMVNAIWKEEQSSILCREFIISGGIKNFLDGYFYTSLLEPVSIYGQASGFLKYARESFEILDQYIEGQTKGLAIARTFLTVKEKGF